MANALYEYSSVTEAEPSLENKQQADEFTHLANINAYYDSQAVQFFELLAEKQIHLGYWDDKYPNISLAQAAKRLTNVVIDYLDVTQKSHLLDIGCGCGIPAIDIIQQKGCRVDGITLNFQQQQKAKSLARETGLSAQANFIVGDANNLPYPPDYFNCALLLESIHHIGHHQAIAETWRVLKPGGSIVIADGVALKENIPTKHAEWLAETFVAKSLLSEQQIKLQLQEAGFSSLEMIDISQAIQATWQKLVELTKQNKAMICKQHGLDFYKQVVAFWQQIDEIWTASARYLIFKAYKEE